MGNFNGSFALFSIGISLLGNILFSTQHSQFISRTFAMESLMNSAQSLLQHSLCACLLLHCILLALTLKYGLFNRVLAAKEDPLHHLSTHTLHDANKPLMVRSLKDLDIFIMGFLDESTKQEFDNTHSHIAHPHKHIGGMTSQAEDMSLDELHLRIESYILRVRQNMWAEAKLETF